MGKSKHTPGPWVYGRWVLLDEDRAAQARGEPYWTLFKPDKTGANCFAQGPLGRKAMQPEEIIELAGWEVEGLVIPNEADAALLEAAPDMYGMLRGALGLTGYATWAASPKAFEKAARELLAKIGDTKAEG